MKSSLVVNGIFVLAAMSCTVVGNLLLKTGVGNRGVSSVWPFSLLNLQTSLGALSFCFAMIFYMMVLQRTALNLAQSIFALQFVLVIIAANVILGEPIGPQRWIGIGLIAVGLFVISLTPPTSLQ
jgi:undecaprenyl phosphate-alpha-L-ara4N flippase subunit ArnE